VSPSAWRAASITWLGLGLGLAVRVRVRVRVRDRVRVGVRVGVGVRRRLHHLAERHDAEPLLGRADLVRVRVRVGVGVRVWVRVRVRVRVRVSRFLAARTCRRTPTPKALRVSPGARGLSGGVFPVWAGTASASSPASSPAASSYSSTCPGLGLGLG